MVVPTTQMLPIGLPFASTLGSTAIALPTSSPAPPMIVQELSVSPAGSTRTTKTSAPVLVVPKHGMALLFGKVGAVVKPVT